MDHSCGSPACSLRSLQRRVAVFMSVHRGFGHTTSECPPSTKIMKVENTLLKRASMQLTALVSTRAALPTISVNGRREPRLTRTAGRMKRISINKNTRGWSAPEIPSRDLWNQSDPKNGLILRYGTSSRRSIRYAGKVTKNGRRSTQQKK